MARTARNARNARTERHAKNRTGLYFALGAFALFLIGMVVSVSFIRSALQPLETLSDPFPDESVRQPDRYPDLIQPPLNILVAASLAPQETGGSLESHLETRAEAIFIVHFRKAHTSTQIVTLPADIVIDIPGRGPGQLGTVMAQGEVSALVHTVENLIQDRINHVALMDMNSVIELTDLVDGIPLETSTGADYEYRNPQEVEQFLVSERAGGAGSPISAQATEQVLQGLQMRLTDPEVTNQSGTLANVRSALEDGVAVDRDLNSGQILNIGRSASALSPSTTTWCSVDTKTDKNGHKIIPASELSELRRLFHEDQLARCGD